jgi:predicted nucleic acid-binding protein
MIVVDTNVIAYMTFATVHTDDIVSLHRKADVWEVPVLWKSEFLNVVSLYYRKKLISFQEGLDAIDYANRLIGKREHFVSDHAVLELAIQSTCSSYTCEFIALAKMLQTNLITFDKKILHFFPDIAMKPLDYLALLK